MKGANFSRLMMRLPCSDGDGGIVSVSGVSLLGQRTALVVFFLVFPLQIWLFPLLLSFPC